MIHFYTKPGISLCGADTPNQGLTNVVANTTCHACLYQLLNGAAGTSWRVRELIPIDGMVGALVPGHLTACRELADTLRVVAGTLIAVLKMTETPQANWITPKGQHAELIAEARATAQCFGLNGKQAAADLVRRLTDALEATDRLPKSRDA